ncbi:ROK family protein [Neobacillus sp. PS3-34]|uniref:ROK family protein n=1 Tax=Neobacillus sp. PS3-34 TaxID=3070678 RepID=UPI0027DECC69|nr:ROK family protein [Neobacillus sp. PS3-34]WML49060.1 ROK family protein [Neobacillus sp. PS3-34]
MRSYLPNDIKDENRKIIYEILLQNPEIAKVEITEKTTMSFVTVSKIVDFFYEIGLVALSGESRDGSGGLGRKRTVYRLNENSFVTVGIQLIERKVAVVLVNLIGEIVDSFSVEAKLPFHSEDFVKYFEDIINEMKKKADERGGTIIGVGLAIDGAINIRKRTVRMRVDDGVEKDFNYEEVIDKLESRVGLPVSLENDVNAATVAELKTLNSGDAGVKNLVNISVGEGIGAGIIINNELYRGMNASAGELEYMCFDENYQKTPSSIGWLEGKVKYSRLKNTYNLSTDQGIEVCIDYLSKKIALSIINIISILDIDHFILSGKSVSLFSDRLLESVKNCIEQYVDWAPTISINLVQNSSAIGAAILSLQHEMNEVLSR